MTMIKLLLLTMIINLTYVSECSVLLVPIPPQKVTPNSTKIVKSDEVNVDVITIDKNLLNGTKGLSVIADNKSQIPIAEEPKEVKQIKEEVKAVTVKDRKNEGQAKEVKTDNKSNAEVGKVIHLDHKDDVIQSGALLRGFYVFLGLSVVVMVYFVCRSYRLRHGAQPANTVRKYGVTARRGDMEMQRLELDDDEEDNTLFDIGNTNR